MLLIQAFMSGLVVFYFQTEAVRQFAHTIGEAKVRGGLPFAFVAGAIAGGLIPEIAKLVTGKLRRYDRHLVGKALWAGVVYGIVGIQVSLLYDAQALWFGTSTDLGTLTLKTVVDMLTFTPFISIPTAAALFSWWKHDFDWSYWRTMLSWSFYKKEVLTAIPLCWAYWIPILYCTYALPTDLQFPFAILAESAWSVLFVFLVVGE